MRCTRLAACALLAACNSDKPCDGPVLELELTFFAPELVKSVLITYEGDGTFEREIHDVQGARSIEIDTDSAPAGETVSIEVSAYESENVRGRLLGEGMLGPLAINLCDRLELELTDRFVLDRDDAGVPQDSGTTDVLDATEPDAGAEDADEPDTGPPPECPSAPDDATLALFPFNSAETTGTTVADVVSGIAGAIRPVQGSVASTSGPLACGDAAAFFGSGYIEIPGEGLAPVLGSVDFYVKFEGASPTARQGIISRDATGQTLSGHITFFRTCDEHLIVRLQDTTRSIWRCSDRPLPQGQWLHVALDFGEPGPALAIDGMVATSTGTRFGNGDCLGTIGCEGTGAFEPSGNMNPWVLGGDSGSSEEGLAEPVRAFFFGAIDQFRVSQVRRFQ